MVLNLLAGSTVCNRNNDALVCRLLYREQLHYNNFQKKTFSICNNMVSFISVYMYAYHNIVYGFFMCTEILFCKQYFLISRYDDF